jgi:putative heme iron utilization protein
MTPDPQFDPASAVRTLLREARSAALATLRPPSGDPYCSLVNVSTAADGSPVLLLSGLAVHTRNLVSDARASLMIDERKPGDPLQGARISIAGRFSVSDDPDERRRYLDRQPEAQMFAGFADFAFYRMQVADVHLVAGFGRIVGLTPAEVLTDLTGSDALLTAEPEVVAHMNADHAEACRLYATRLLGAADGPWRCVGCDPDGLDLQFERQALRLPFGRRITSPGELRQVLRALADEARSR